MISVEELRAAWENLWRMQEVLACYPPCLVEVNGYTFLMGEEMGATSANVLTCTLPDQLLRDILDRKVHWNNAEIGCLIRFNRAGPYLPDVHTLMSFFHLPRPT